MDDIKLTNEILENQIKNIVIPMLFYNLNYTEKNILYNLTVKIINTIAICFRFDIKKNREKYIYQFEQNNYQDIKWIILHLLPYINIENDSNKITSFQDIYTNKKTPCDINTQEPNYLYSNIQYNRCIREKNDCKEKKFNINDIIHNYYILVDTIKNCSNKLCVNWTNILPYDMVTYRKGKLYRDTVTSYLQKKMKDWEPTIDTNYKSSNETICVNLNEKMNGLYIGHIYEEIADLYHGIVKYKWIIFDLYLEGKLATMTEFIATHYINMDDIFLCISEWDNLDQINKIAFMEYTEKLIKSIKTNTLSSKNKKYDINTIKMFMKGFTVSFDKSPYKNQAKKEGYESLSEKLDENLKIAEAEAKEDEEDSAIPFEYIFNCFCSIPPKFIYEYIAESLQKLKQTWYGYYLLSKDKKKIEIIYDKIFTDKYDENDKITHVPYDIVEYQDNTELIPNFDDILNWISYFNNNIQTVYKTQPQIFGDILFDMIENIKKADYSIKLQAKNIYNFAKSFCHSIDGFKILPKNWVTLTQEEKNEIINEKINCKNNPLKWFRIPKYIEKSGFHKNLGQNENMIELFENAKKIDELIQTDNKKSNAEFMQIDITNLLIYNMLKKIIIDIVFRSLIHKGILTKFVPDNELSEKRLLLENNMENILKTQKSKEKINKIFDESDSNYYWTNTYHYMTSLPYKFMDEKKYKILNYDGKEHNFFSYCKIDPWYIAGAYDWIGQIGFCHHFLNNRVIFITGGTGVGKSTEIPKLFVYYSRVLDGILAPKVVCTQPRQQPVKDNSTRVSTTLGVPIFYGDKKTENFNIQFKYKGNKHQEKIHSPSLLFITGDSLMMEFNDPFLKKKYYKNKDSDDINYQTENLYDIIMIDEAHEHKKHMDLLMSFLKLPISANNSLRLVIVSATMDDDEARYRRYFRDINDNKKYPLNMWISDNKIDRINVDRRFHVAAPGAGTKYEIKEHYRPPTDDSEEKLYTGIKNVVNEILQKSSNGDILIFQPGKAEIDKTIEILVNNTPSNVFIFPFNRELDDDHKKPTSDINARKNIRINKRDDFSAMRDLTKGNNKYDRFIIVATNIAEASVTIPELKFVIETGTEKANKYDYKKRSDTIFKDIISESSRRQRKGRVGRRSTGEVYYMYKKGLTENNKIPYEFSRMKIDDILYKYLRNDTEEEINDLIIYDLCNKNINIILENIKSQTLRNIIENQYFIGTGKNKKFYNYYGQEEMYDYDNYTPPKNYYKTGTDGQTLNDCDGEYFIIHPDELDLVRNIIGDIVGVNNQDVEFKKIGKYKGTITSKKMESFWKLLLEKMYIAIVKNKNILDFVKTDMGNFFYKNQEIFGTTNENLTRCIAYGLSLNYDDIIKFCALCEVSAFDITNMFLTYTNANANNRQISMIPNIYTRYGTNIESDGYVVMKILNGIHDILEKYGYDDNSENIIKESYLDTISLNNEKINLTKRNMIDLIKNPNNLQKETRDMLNIENIGDLMEKGLNIIKDNIRKNFNKNTKCVTELFNYYKSNYLNAATMDKYLKLYFDIKFNIIKLKNKQEEAVKFINNLKQKMSNIDEYYKKDKLKTSLLFGFPQNIVVNIINTEKYLSIYSPTFDNIFSISSFSQNMPKTFITKQNSMEYLLFLNTSAEREEILYLFKLNITDIILLSHIYHANFNVFLDKEKFIESKIKKYEELKKIKTINIKKAQLLTLGQISNDTIVNFIQTLNKFIIALKHSEFDANKNLEFLKSLEPKMKIYINNFLKLNKFL